MQKSKILYPSIVKKKAQRKTTFMPVVPRSNSSKLRIKKKES